ncbi:nucleoside triphosphate pyrophosphohydrolase family protein [Tepidimicrobium xylanilyticum]|uniref:MazG nucleotide pyrophosphohydrolase domain-containing protein n=1 Tax=Tepidimicrobium xylanilyticum TaxID=1123352 RepID=A0A1H3F4D2_9FIRM|nr:hypothetical protein [Tepidimicrobium xylanilyticum]SDX85740.1 hypothetical protein SAMN05660923_03062 [Tepidimicrobium xylanilyticum]
MDEREVYKQALEKWGAEGQITMVFEEMAELQKELCKSLRGKENRIEIAEEIADVEIMLEQMKILFGIEEGVERHKTLKLQRLEGRLKRQEGQLWR